MAVKRIYQLAKEFECEEKAIIDFLTEQGVKVGNRLSAVSEEAFEMIKKKFAAPPEPEPAPEPEPVPEPEPQPEPAPVEEAQPQPQAQGEQPPAQGGGKKKKKKNKNPQGDPNAQFEPDNQGAPATPPPPAVAAVNTSTQASCREAIEAGNQFIESYKSGVLNKKQAFAAGLYLHTATEPWTLIQEIKVEYPDSTPMRYWQAVDKLSTKAFKVLQSFGMIHRDDLAEMRNVMQPLSLPFEPREIFTDAENHLFDEQRDLLFRLFGHGVGAVNDKLYALKQHAWDMKLKYEYMDFTNYITSPADELRCKERAPFDEMVDAVAVSISGVARRYYFYVNNKERVTAAVANFLEWIDSYAKLKEQGAPAAKLEKYLELEKKFVAITEFMSFENILYIGKKKPAPYDTVTGLLKDYRDNLDDPDAERNFKYKVRGVTNVIYKPKEYVFLCQFADLEPNKDYRPPEEIAAAEAAAKSEAEPEPVAETEAPAENKESPANDEA